MVLELIFQFLPSKYRPPSTQFQPVIIEIIIVMVKVEVI